ncbi:chaplin family protein [Streptomyces sp. NPDC007107]|uniref:chaplin family protein n=1 Tax=Streptomyces sp. NPDC007107 TaxID=3156915 RepID=UPI0033EEBC67
MAALAAAATVVMPAGTATAGVVSVGSGAFGNTAITHGAGAMARGATASGSGALGGNVSSLPLDLPRNRAGNSGLVCVAGPD